MQKKAIELVEMELSVRISALPAGLQKILREDMAAAVESRLSVLEKA